MVKRVNDDESKIFDVSKPGKGKVVATSRPVITVSEIAKDPTLMEQNEPTVKSPSQSHKVIQPLAAKDKTESVAEEVVKVKVSTPVQEAVAPDKKLSVSDQPVELEKPENNIEAPEGSVEKEKPAEETKQAEVAASIETESSDMAVVDALAGSIASKKEAAKIAEEQVKRDAQVEELIESRKYFVKIGHEPSKKTHQIHQRSLVVILILVFIVSGMYVAADAGLIDLGFTVPFELIK